MLERFQKVLDENILFRYLYQNARHNAMQVMDEDGYILHVNEVFQFTFGYTLDEICGKHSRVLFTEEDRKKLMPEMEIEKVKQHGSAIDKNYTVHKDGSCIWVSGESVLVKTEDNDVFIFKILQDIHEEKLLEKFLKDAQELSENVIRVVKEAVLVTDTGGKILKANNSFYNIFQINLESIEGLLLSDIDNPFISSADLQQKLQQVLDTEADVEWNDEWKDKEANPKFISVHATLLDGKLVNKKIMLLISDVTEQIQTDQRRDDLISFVIHELRNPLANITLCTELLEQSIADNDKEGTKEFLEKTKSNTNRLNTLIRELFDATKAGSGSMQFIKSVFNFEDLLTEAIESVQLSVSSHTIIKEGSADVDVYADRNRLLQVLNNYLTNAVKYSTNANKVDINVSMAAGQVVVAVRDYGNGISEEEIPNIFNRYYRVDKTAKAEGLGLGLFLCKQIIDAHKGRVWLESKVDEGTTFYFSIPY